MRLQKILLATLVVSSTLPVYAYLYSSKDATTTDASKISTAAIPKIERYNSAKSEILFIECPSLYIQTSEMNTLVSAAQTLAESIVSSTAAGADVLPTQYWVPPIAKHNFLYAIECASQSNSTDLLKKAQAEFISLKKLGQTVDKGNLISKITNAKKLIANIIASDNGYDLPTYKQYVPILAHIDLSDTIASAETVAHDAEATAIEINSTEKAIAASMTDFEANIAVGTATAPITADNIILANILSHQCEEDLMMKKAATTSLVQVPDVALRQAIVTIYPSIEFNANGETSIQNLNSLSGEFEAIGKGIQKLDGLQYATELTYINLDDNHIQDIHALSKLPHLKKLSINNNNIKVLDLFGFTSLSELSVNNNQIKSILFSELHSAISQLVTLDLSQNMLGDFLTHSELMELGYDNTEMLATSSGARAIDALAQAAILKKLNLADNKSLVDISVVEYCDNLADLNLVGNTALAEGIEVLGTLDYLENLEIEALLFNNEETREKLISVIKSLTFMQEDAAVTDTTIIIESDLITEDVKEALRIEVLELLSAVLEEELDNGLITEFPEIVINDTATYEFDRDKKDPSKKMSPQFDYLLKIHNSLNTQDAAELMIELSPNQHTKIPHILLEATEVITAVTKMVQTALFNSAIPKVIVDVTTTNNVTLGIKLEMDFDLLKSLMITKNAILEIKTKFVSLVFDSSVLEGILDKADSENVIFKITEIPNDKPNYNKVVNLEIVTANKYFEEFEDRVAVKFPNIKSKFLL
ncbi:leucine-rich repeat domain-containing protein [Candidatus Epulonipiscium viviparus]|uniref:leucine-rich repeat domain-containing protein n=1 Tax=Candidatus Epulonipiscium viviparus TaxID=420336 RepID=UPI0027381130|nr:hypothetical protein [Candidatus Epulopiscium viviparus]